jgi:predicted permease
MEGLLRDMRHALRRLLGAPGFTTIAAVTLALGLGANTAIFSVVDVVLLRPLPYADPAQRVMVWSRWRNFEKTWVNPWEMTAYAQRCPSVAEMAFWQTGAANLTGGGEAARVTIGRVSHSVFSVLGAPPALGRAFAPEEDRAGGPRLAILADELWRRRYGADPGILGRSVEIDGIPSVVVGVMAPGFALPTDFGEDAAEPTQILIPRRPDAEELTAGHGSHSDFGAARLAPGADVASLNRELSSATEKFVAEGLVPREMKFTAFAVSLGDEITGPYRPAVLLVTVGVMLLMLVACANVANLLLAQAASRQREMALRTALGAGRLRLVRQLLIEGLGLSVLGGLLSLGIAWAGLQVLRWLGPTTLPRAAAAVVDTRALAFALALSVAVTLLFAMAPALHSTRVDLVESLKEGGSRSVGSLRRRRWRGSLIVAETALAVLLAVGAGLMARSLRALQAIDVGFDPKGVLTLSLSLPETAYSQPARVDAFYRGLLQEVRALPGVSHAGLLRRLPLGQAIGDWGVAVEGFVPDAAGAAADWQVASGGAAEALGERIEAGRFLSDADTAEAPQVAVINGAMARRFWPGRDPVGARMRMGGKERPWLTVVGVVGDVKHAGLTGGVKPKFYRPVSQFHLSTGWPPRGMNLVVKAAGDPLALAAPIRAVVRRLDPSVPVADLRTMEDVVAMSIAAPRFTGALLGLFALLSLALASAGVHGVLSYAVSERRQEIGVRSALGATARDIVGMVVREGAVLVGAGLALGLVLAFAVTRVMRSLLHEVAPADPTTYLVVAATVALTALLAAALPARRAARVDPALALREE